MPELPEVTTVVKYLNKEVKDKKISQIDVKLPKLLKNISQTEFIKNLTGETIKSIENIGKFIVFHFSNNKILVSHLRMEGKYRTSDNHSSDHIIFNFENGDKLIYNDTRQFGTFHYSTEKDYLFDTPIKKLANEPKDTNPNLLHQKLIKKSIAIKTALLDQSLLVGLGNIYVNEVLYISHISPTRPSNGVSLEEIKLILKNANEILQKAILHGGTTIHSFKSFNNQDGNYQQFILVHGKENKPCPECKSAIKKIWVNGRGTYYCHYCQK